MYGHKNLSSTQPLPNRLYEEHTSFPPEFEVTKLNTVDSYMSSQKESIDNLYDTLKNEISPQKISDFNKLVLDFNGYINKLSIENSRLKNKLVKSQEKLKNLEKKLIYHDKNRRRLEASLQKKTEIEADLLKEKELLIEENQNLLNQLEEAKNLITKIKQNSEITMKENLRRNFSEWQKHEKNNFIKMKKSMETEIIQRVRQAKEESEENFQRQIETLKNSYSMKENDVKNFYEEKLRNDIKALEEKFNDKFNYEKEMIHTEFTQKFEEYQRNFQVKMSREKRNTQQEMIETFEDSIMMKDKIIKQMQQDQKDMALKIQILKKGMDSENYKSVTSRNSYDDDQNSFLTEINQRLTYAKMRMGFNSNEPSLNNEFYAWIHETSVDTEFEDPPNRRKEKRIQGNIFENDDNKENFNSFQKPESPLSTEKKSTSNMSNFKIPSSQKSMTKHIKIEGISTGFPMEMNSKPTERIKTFKLDTTNNFILNPKTDLCQSEFTLRGLEQSFSNKLSVKKMELSSAKKQKINLMKEGSPLDCHSLSKENDNDDQNSENRWSECWVKVSNKLNAGSFKSEMQKQVSMAKIDNDLIKNPMMTLDLSVSDKHHSNNLTNILSTHTFTRNDETMAESDFKRKAERLQEKIDKTINKNVSGRNTAHNSHSHSLKSSVKKDSRELIVNENSPINLNSARRDLSPKNLNTPKRSLSKTSKFSQEIQEIETDTPNENIKISKPCFEVKYESLMGEEEHSNSQFPQVDDILTLHNDSSRNTQCEKKSSLIQQFEFKANDVNFKN